MSSQVDSVFQYVFNSLMTIHMFSFFFHCGCYQSSIVFFLRLLANWFEQLHKRWKAHLSQIIWFLNPQFQFNPHRLFFEVVKWRLLKLKALVKCDILNLITCFKSRLLLNILEISEPWGRSFTSSLSWLAEKPLKTNFYFYGKPMLINMFSMSLRQHLKGG